MRKSVPLSIQTAVCDNIRDGMCFSTTRGSIRKDSGIVSLQHTVQQRLRCSFVYIALRHCVVEDAVKCKCLVF